MRVHLKMTPYVYSTVLPPNPSRNVCRPVCFIMFRSKSTVDICIRDVLAAETMPPPACHAMSQLPFFFFSHMQRITTHQTIGSLEKGRERVCSSSSSMCQCQVCYARARVCCSKAKRQRRVQVAVARRQVWHAWRQVWQQKESAMRMHKVHGNDCPSHVECACAEVPTAAHPLQCLFMPSSQGLLPHIGR